MPANEQTWRNVKLLHVVFGVSSVVMLITTIWMMADDHNRPWKEYQRKFRDLDVWTTQARINEQESADYVTKLETLKDAVMEAQRQFNAADRQNVDTFLDADQKASEEYVRAAKENGLTVKSPWDKAASDQIRALAENLVGQTDPDIIRAGRLDLVTRMNKLIAGVKFREDNMAFEVKGLKQGFDQANSQYAQAVDRNANAEELARRQKTVDKAKEELDNSTRLLQRITEHRSTLEKKAAVVTAAEDKAKKDLKAHQLAIEQLNKAIDERAGSYWARMGKSALEMPIIDAFGSPLKPANRWLPQLPWNNNFKDVARFDRCETCHQGMERTLPGAPTSPAFPANYYVPIDLVTTAEAFPADAKKKTEPKSKDEKSAKDEKGSAESKSDEAAKADAGKSELDKLNAELIQRFGFRLAKSGVFGSDDVTIDAVYPLTGASVSGLMTGDVISTVSDARVQTPAEAGAFLLAKLRPGEPLKLKILRGVPHPYASHPRLDLFVGSTSPHPLSKFGCTICHNGQGSATAFKWSSHTPNSLVTATEWGRKYDWFNNENWTYPMFPKRFQEAACLKCHHEVVDLEPSVRFPDPPAPKVVEGYEIIRRYGCFGCHEINGYNGPDKRVGPDLRTEPNYSAAASELLVDPGLAKLSPQAVGWAEQVVLHPDDAGPRRRLLELISAEAQRAKLTTPDSKSPKTVLDADSLRMESVLKDVEAPGKERRVGPSLRHVGSKLSFEFLTSWIANPSDFRPDTRMPRFFGQWEHLDGRGLEDAQRMEPIEIRAIADYLSDASQKFEYAEHPAGVPDSTEAEKIARGKKTFETRGCLACHQHADFKKDNVALWNGLLAKVPGALKGADFPEVKATQGPDLSRMGDKLGLDPEKGRKWLYSWVKNPSRYHPRTFMPVLFLDQAIDADGKASGPDPADDVTEFLMHSQQGWKPTNALPNDMHEADLKALDELTLLHLSDKFPLDRAKKYLYDGIPPEHAGDVQGQETALVLSPEDAADLLESAKPAAGDKQPEESPRHRRARIARNLRYVGLRTISKYGCFGCHDIPGYEDAKPIGTSLADWGRKLPARLAFEQIIEYVQHYPNGLHGAAEPAKGASGPSKAPLESAPIPDSMPDAPAAANAEKIVTPESLPADEGYFMEKLLSEEREGFLWQKLRAPRSFDFRKTENKKYNDRLRMPRFTFAPTKEENQQRIERVMTFVLGLVAEPPPPAFVYQPLPQQAAIVTGHEVLEKFNCAGCHILEMERWEVDFKPGQLGKSSAPADYSFLAAHFPPDDIAKSKKIDRAGQEQTTLFGIPVQSSKAAKGKDGKPVFAWAPVRLDDEDSPIEPDDTTSKVYYPFMMFQPALIGGEPRLVGQSVKVSEAQLARRYPSRGGDLARFLFPIVVHDEPTYAEKANEAWGWLPPPLVGEGKKVQTPWLHDFLLDPFQIRPAAVLRMPKFNMSSNDASQLVSYFAAMDGAEYPYEYDDRTRDSHLESLDAAYQGKYLDGGLAIVTDNNYCVKCHKVGDFSPTGSLRAMAPRLDRVHDRLRPEYVHRWVANPVRILPYTGMPVNIPPDKPVAQTLFKGNSEQQLDGVVDLLMNFTRFTQSQFSIKRLIKPAGPAAPLRPDRPRLEQPQRWRSEQRRLLESRL